MTLTKRLTQAAGLVAGVIGVVGAVAPETGVGRTARRLAGRLARDVRYAASSAPGMLYRLAGRGPDPDVSDDVIADRIRSAIGPLEKRLDLPRVHVMVEDHVALLHGDVTDEDDAGAIQHAVMRVSGVNGVVSHLHLGLLPGDTRPSEGAGVTPPASDALRALLDVARDAGAGERPVAAVHAVLCGFMDRLPEGERGQVLAHLPVDVRALAGSERPAGARAPRLKTFAQFVAAVTAVGGIEPRHAEVITRAVLATLRGLVYEEQQDVAAVLPAELRELWETESAR